MSKEEILNNLVNQIFSSIQRFCGDNESGSHDPIDIGRRYPDFRDEIYCQIMKQLTMNPSKPSAHKGWLLLTLISTEYPPLPATTSRPSLSSRIIVTLQNWREVNDPTQLSVSSERSATAMAPPTPPKPEKSMSFFGKLLSGADYTFDHRPYIDYVIASLKLWGDDFRAQITFPRHTATFVCPQPLPPPPRVIQISFPDDSVVTVGVLPDDTVNSVILRVIRKICQRVEQNWESNFCVCTNVLHSSFRIDGKTNMFDVDTGRNKCYICLQSFTGHDWPKLACGETDGKFLVHLAYIQCLRSIQSRKFIDETHSVRLAARQTQVCDTYLLS